MYRAGGVAIDERPELWVHAGGAASSSSSVSDSGSGTCSIGSSRSREYAPDEPFMAAGFEVTPLRLPHYTLETYGLRLSADGSTIAYSGDSGPSERLVDLARGTDMFVCEATLDRGADDGQPRGHLSADEALAAAAASGTKRLLLTHRPAELETPPGVERAYDGLELEV